MSGKLGHTKDLFIILSVSVDDFCRLSISFTTLVIHLPWDGDGGRKTCDVWLWALLEKWARTGTREENKPGPRRWRRDVCAAWAWAVTLVARAGECTQWSQPPQSCHNRAGRNMWVGTDAGLVTWDHSWWILDWEELHRIFHLNSDTLLWCWLVTLTAINQLRAV